MKSLLSFDIMLQIVLQMHAWPYMAQQKAHLHTHSTSDSAVAQVRNKKYEIIEGKEETFVSWILLLLLFCSWLFSILSFEYMCALFIRAFSLVAAYGNVSGVCIFDQSLFGTLHLSLSLSFVFFFFRFTVYSNAAYANGIRFKIAAKPRYKS